MRSMAKSARTSTRAKKLSNGDKTSSRRQQDESSKLKIFISYASEDTELVDGIKLILRQMFDGWPVDVFRDLDNIKQGENYRNEIDTELDRADVLLVVFTDRAKSSHSYTGYEIGYFNRSIQLDRNGTKGVKRTYIPLCIGANIPDTLNFMQGANISKDDIINVSKVENGALDVDFKHPAYKLLNTISELASKVFESTEQRSADSIKKYASELYVVIYKYLQNRICDEAYPERKIVIRMSSQPKIKADGIDLSSATIILVGNFNTIFSVPETRTKNQFSWDDFCEQIPIELRANCVSGIKMLITGNMDRSGDNYHIISTVKHDKAYRLFVSKVVKYYSGLSEIHIYLVQIKAKTYGDSESSRLLKAISVGLRFRFLVLEKESQFRPEILGYPNVKSADLKPKISEMMAEMALILKDAYDANLDDPSIMIKVWGSGQEAKVHDMMVLWESSWNNLCQASNEVLNSVDESSFLEKKAEFVCVLREFCASVDLMNREFTARVLSLLTDQVKAKVGDEIMSMASPSKSS